jgi:hypothetical protein
VFLPRQPLGFGSILPEPDAAICTNNYHKNRLEKINIKLYNLVTIIANNAEEVL